MNEKLISIIVPVYNVEPYLEKCIDSILKQTYKNFELIIVDDGSTDGCPALCDKIAKLDSRITVIHKKNGGLSSARNAGLEVAKGDYIGFIDSDDWIVPDMYEQMMLTMSQNHCQCVACNYFLAYGEEKIVPHMVDTKEIVLSTERIREKLCARLNGEKNDLTYFFAWNKLFTREVWGDMRFDETLKNGEDRWMMFNMYQRIDRIAICHQPLVYYRQRLGLSASCNKQRKFDYTIGRRMLEKIQSEGGFVGPYVETIVVHLLGWVRQCAKNNDKETYWKLNEEFQELWNEIKKVIKTATWKYKILLLCFKYIPRFFYNSMKLVYKMR